MQANLLFTNIDLIVTCHLLPFFLLLLLLLLIESCSSTSSLQSSPLFIFLFNSLFIKHTWLNDINSTQYVYYKCNSLRSRIGSSWRVFPIYFVFTKHFHTSITQQRMLKTLAEESDWIITWWEVAINCLHKKEEK